MLRHLRELSLAVLLITTVCGMTLIAGQTTDAPETPPLVDINSAPVEQIEAIVQNEALAAKIVEGRPYANKRQLLTRNLVTSEEYEKIQNRIIARQVQQNP